MKNEISSFFWKNIQADRGVRDCRLHSRTMNNINDESIHHKDTLPGVSNVCRLCSAKDNLIDFFNEQSEISDFFRSLILYGTGLEIKEDDIVSKMVCQRCCEIAVKLHRYRSKAMNNDKLLKAQYGIPQEQSIENTLHLFNGHDNSGNKSDFSLHSIVAENTRNNSEGNIINRQFTITHKDVIPQPKIVSRRPKYRHPSVVKLHKQYSGVIIPQKVFCDDVSPVVTLDKSEVTDWYETQLQNLRKKLPHIKFNKVTDVNSSSNIEKCDNKDSSSNDITSTPANNDVINKNIILKRRVSLISTCGRKDSSINDQNKSTARVTSDTNRNSRISIKSKVRPTARKSTTIIKANVPKQITPIRKRSLSNSSTSTIGDYAAFFDNALTNSSLQSEESDNDHPKKRPCSRKKKNNSSSSSQTGFISDRATENSKSFSTANTLKAVTVEKRKERDRRDRRDSPSTSHIDLISDKGTQESKSLETVSTFKIISMEKRRERKNRSSSSSNSLTELAGDKLTENLNSLGNLGPIKAVATEKRKKSEDKDISHSASSSKGSLINDKLEITKSVERTSMINALLADKREEISCLQKSEKRVPKILQKARKKTAKLAATSVKDKITENGKISKKKNKKYFNKDMLTDFNSFDTLDSNPSSWSMEGNILPGKSTSDLDSLFVLKSGKTLAVFICAVCSLVCDTKRQLVDHEKTHLTCKFCKVKIKNLQLLIEHLNDTCVINVMRDNARVRLVRVDDNPSIVEKYRTAFQNDKILYYESNDDDDDDGGGGGAFDNNDDFVKEECDQEEPLIKHEEVKLESTENEADIICLSDTNDDPVEFSVVQRHTIVEEEDIQIDDELKIINRTDDNDIYLFDAMLKHHSSETEMMKTLFKKYYHGLIKFDKRSQTFRNSNRCVRRTSNNLILLERMLSELTVYIVAVNVECRASITARFNAPQTPPVSPLEYWGHKKTICIVKRVKNKSPTKPKEVSLSSELKSRPPIQVVSVEPKFPLTNMSIEEITPPPQTCSASSLPCTIPTSLELVKPSPPNSFQNVFIATSNVPTNTSVSSVLISLIPTPDAQVLPNSNYSLITTTSNSSVSNCLSNPSTSGNQNNLVKNKFVVVSSSNVPQPISETPIEDANCISSNQPNATSSSNPATVE